MFQQSVKGVSSLPLIDKQERAGLNPKLTEIIDYRKSGLSLNHIIGCSLDCGYCVRHFFDNFEMKQPYMLCSDDEAVAALINHRFFKPHSTPIQLFNRATDPFLPTVKPHTHKVLTALDTKGFTNQVLVITRAAVTEEDMASLEELRNLKVTLLFTYSGINDPRIEPIAPSGTTVKSIRTAAACRSRTKLILYWRPLVPGWNTDEATMRHVLEVGRQVDAIVFTGYYHRLSNHKYLEGLGVSVPYEDDQRRKVLPLNLDHMVVRLHAESKIDTPLFRKTSCGVAYSHAVADYNGHFGVNEICDICPEAQQRRCSKSHTAPTAAEFQDVLHHFGYETEFTIEDGHIWTSGLGEERRYHLQHTFGYQVWDVDYPHLKYGHGRAPIGYNDADRYS